MKVNTEAGSICKSTFCDHAVARQPNESVDIVLMLMYKALHKACLVDQRARDATQLLSSSHDIVLLHMHGNFLSGPCTGRVQGRTSHAWLEIQASPEWIGSGLCTKHFGGRAAVTSKNERSEQPHKSRVNRPCCDKLSGPSLKLSPKAEKAYGPSDAT